MADTGEQGVAGGIRQRLRDAPPWVWISIVLGAGVLVLAYLSYRKQQQSATSTAGLGQIDNGTSNVSAGAVPIGGTGQPFWPTDQTGAGDPLGEALALLSFLQNPNTPTPSSPSTPSGSTTGTYVTSNGNQTLAQIASANGAKGDVTYYAGNNNGVRQLINKLNPKGGANKYATTVLPKGTTVYIPAA